MVTALESTEGRLRVLAAVATVYLVLFGVALAFWLNQSGVAATPVVIGACLLPAVMGLVLARTSTEDWLTSLK